MPASTLFVSALMGLAPLANALAFPGAIGFGADATGGNGGTKCVVSTLADSGAGSFRDCVSKGGRTVTFSVSGYINLKTAVSLSSDLTIDGASAPAPGIGTQGAEISASDKDNIIITNFRIRQGTLDTNKHKSAINLGHSSNVIIDHCSFAFGQWDTIDAVGAVNFTVSNSIIAYPIGQQFGAHVETGPSTFFGNLWVSAHNRQPLSKDDTQFINNVIYNYQAGYTAGNTGGKFRHDIINNYFIAGPSTTSPNNRYFQMNANQAVYASGNFGDSTKDGKLNGVAENTVGSATVLQAPWAPTSTKLVKWSAAEAVPNVLASAGAFPRDEVDALAVKSVQSYGTEGKLIKDQASLGLSNGGYGTL